MDLFISYAHEDAAFVQRLREALVARGREVWVDTEGIEPSDRWRGSAQEAIERADTFVFVLSLASLGSDPCRGELDHALSLNKRLIVICVEQAAADAQTPPAVSELSWIMMRPGDDFERGIGQLVHALDTDLEIARIHTRILVRAKAWELADRRSSPLLRGEELNAAEEWIARASGGGGPAPTELQREFILASRRSVSRRQRLIAAISSGVAIVAVALSIFALIQRSAAISNQKTAQSRLLAAEAEAHISSDASLSTLLSLKALQVRDTIQAEQALRDSLANLQTLVTFKGDTDSVATVDYNGDGSKLVTASEDGTARIWNVRTGAQLLELRPTGGSLPPLNDASFSPDGSRVVTAGHDGTARVYDTTSGRELVTLHVGSAGVVSASFSPDGSRVLTASVAARVWNASTGALLLTINTGPRGLLNAAYNPSGSAIVTVGYDGSVRCFSALSGRMLWTARPNKLGLVSGAAFSPDGSRIVVAGNSTVVLDAANGRTLMTLIDPSTGFSVDTSAASFSADGSRILTTTGAGIELWDARSGAQLAALSSPSTSIDDVQLSPNGSLIAAANGDHTAAIWTASALGALRSERDPMDEGELTSASYSPDGSQFATTDSGGALRVWPARAIGTSRLLLEQKDDQLSSEAYSPDGSRIVVAGYGVHSPGVTILAVASGTPLVRFARNVLSVATAVFSPDGSRILTAGQGAAVWSATTGTQLQTLQAQTTQANAASYSPDGTRIAVADQDDAVVIYSSASGRRLLTLTGDSGAIESVAFSPDGTRILTASADGTARVWNARTGAQLLVLAGHQGPVDDAVFSPSGRLIATGGADGTVRIWDAGSGTQLVSFVDQPNPTFGTGNVPTVAFNPSGSELLATGQDGTVTTFSTTLAGPIPALEKLARSLVTRPLTAQERAEYLAGVA